MRIALRVLAVVLLLCLLYPAALLALYFFAPRENSQLAKVDTLIVLGCPTKPDGSPSAEQAARVMESVREFKRGVSDHIIMTGGAAHNRFTEAHAMAVLAEANGVPAESVIEEGQAHDTVQNIYYSDKIMQERGWKTTEVISSPYHLSRTALILRRFPRLQWETHAANWPDEFGLDKKLQLDWKEAVSCFKIRMHGFRTEKYFPPAT